METKKTITIQLTNEQHKIAKIAAAHAGMTFKEIFLSAIDSLEGRRQSSQIEDKRKNN